MDDLLRFLCICALGVAPVVGCGDTNVVVYCGGGGASGSGGTGIDPECEIAEDCDDGNACNEDVCIDDVCEHTLLADGTACGNDAGTCQQGSCMVACTEQGLRDAIAEGGGPYTFDCDGPTTVMTEAEILIDNDVVLNGEGNFTANANSEHRVFAVPDGATVELRGFGITRGGRTGGGIYNIGVLTLANSTVSGNTTLLCGGGIDNDGTMWVTNTTVSDNVAFGCGGGIFNEGAMTITNSTVSGNFAPEGTALGIGGPRSDRDGTTMIAHTILDGDCDNLQVLTSLGGNIESEGNTCGLDHETDMVNVSAAALNLGPLADNGGGTLTHALLPGSVAIDAIPEPMCEVDEDQRGVPRPQGPACDVGAFESE